MNDAEYEAQRARLKVLIDRWIYALGLGWWRITNSYDRTGEDFADAAQVDHGFHTGVAARCYPEWRYLMATIVWNMPEVERMDDETLEIAFVHELMHIFLHELHSDDEDHLAHEERVASMLSKAFIWARNAAMAGQLGASTATDPYDTTESDATSAPEPAAEPAHA